MNGWSGQVAMLIVSSSMSGGFPRRGRPGVPESRYRYQDGRSVEGEFQGILVSEIGILHVHGQDIIVKDGGLNWVG